jgi:S1-C subfamily serine protease
MGRWFAPGLESASRSHRDLAKSFNLRKGRALISQVFEKSPAEKADLRVGDVVVEIDGAKVRSSQRWFAKS